MSLIYVSTVHPFANGNVTVVTHIVDKFIATDIRTMCWARVRENYGRKVHTDPELPEWNGHENVTVIGCQKCLERMRQLRLLVPGATSGAETETLP